MCMYIMICWYICIQMYIYIYIYVYMVIHIWAFIYECIFIYMYILINIYMYIVIHRQICFVLSELISVGRQYLPVAGIETRLTQTPSQRLYIYIYIYIYVYIVTWHPTNAPLSNPSQVATPFPSTQSYMFNTPHYYCYVNTAMWTQTFETFEEWWLDDDSKSGVHIVAPKINR